MADESLIDRFIAADQGRFENIINYREHRIPLDANDRQIVRGVAQKMGVNLTHSPTMEDANHLLQAAYNIAVQNLCRCSVAADQMEKAGRQRAAKAWKDAAAEWQREEIRARWALEGGVRSN